VSLPTRWREWLIGLLPPLALLGLLALASGYAIYFRFRGEETADERTLREWLEESRVFRKTLSELGREFLSTDSAELRERLRQELEDQLRAKAAPLRQFATHLPLFPTVYRLELHLRPSDGGRARAPGPPPGLDGLVREQGTSGNGTAGVLSPSLSPGELPSPVSLFAETVVVWDSGLPFDPDQVRRLHHVLVEEPVGTVSAVLWYQLHAFSHQQRLVAEQERFTWGLLILIVSISFAAVTWVAVYLLRQRRREQEAAAARQRLEEARRLALENELRRQQAEQEALQLRSQMFANLAILAGSYAHNIKNLLVRPMALLRQCLQQPVEDHLRTALHEVEATLGTVTDRLQEILHTVRRDPAQTERVHFDLNELAREVHAHWSELARERWKLELQLELSPEPIPVFADRSQILQAVENLLFNARDATFEMRNRLRQRAYAEIGEAEARKQALLQAAAWRGLVTLRTYRLPTGVANHLSPSISPTEWAVLEVSDNGVGMTPEVLARCTEPYFTTKRDSALYEGNATGIGLGLTFVRLIIEQHGGRIEIQSRTDFASSGGSHSSPGTQVRLLLPIHPRDLLSASRNSAR